MEESTMNTDDRWRTRSLALAIGAAISTGYGIANADTTTAVASCESLATLAFPDTTITAAQQLPAGPTTIIGTTAPNTTAPVFGTFNGTIPVPICRVRGTIKPTSVSNIIFEAWMPVSGWNGKFLVTGRGGTAGSLGLSDLVGSVGQGYAGATTDTGHQSNDSAFALVSDELVEDFAHRGYHLTTQVGKQVIAAYYGAPASRSYFTGCSTGGAEALSEVQRYPDDFDGIVAGAPANHYSLMWPGEVFPSWVDQSDFAALTTKLPALNQAAVAACDATDGLVDGLVSDPRKCSWDPVSIQCPTGVDNTSCLNPAQVAQVRRIYQGFADAFTGAQIWPPYLRGSEDQWGGHLSQGTGANGNPPVNYFRFFVYKNPSWFYTDPAFNMDSAATLNDIYAADLHYAPILDSVDPDLRPFGWNGRKIIMYHGWKDQNIAPLNSVNYYNQVVARVAGFSNGFPSAITEQSPLYKAALKKTQNFARLFMVPGMQHCNGGPGPNTFDALGALVQWVENGVAPDQIMATHSTAGVVDRTRPLCTYPKVATYTGTGSINDAANFVCQDPS
jgi:feruloyl esterase